MISVHMLTRDQVEQTLLDMGCTELESPLDDHSAWQTAWGQSFLVPQVGDDKMTSAWKLEEIIEQVDKSKPLMH